MPRCVHKAALKAYRQNEKKATKNKRMQAIVMMTVKRYKQMTRMVKRFERRSVCEDFPSRVTKAQNVLRSFLREAFKNKKDAYLKYDRFVINGEMYDYDEASEDIVQVDADKQRHGRGPGKNFNTDLGYKLTNFTLKVATWNIEGLGKYENDGGLIEYAKFFDIISFFVRPGDKLHHNLTFDFFFRWL